MNETFKIGNQSIGKEHRPFVVAELSGNHNKSLDRAIQLIHAAHEAGAHAVKLQTYTADTMTLDSKDPHFQITDPKSLWNGRYLYELYDEAHTPWEWHKEIFEICNNLGITCFSAPFDLSAIEFLEKLNCPAYKIASFENTDVDLIASVSQTGKPVIISTGMANVSEIYDAVNVARKNGCQNLVLLKCTSTYPASPESCNVLTIPHMKDLFQCEVGLSDHTMGIGVSVASVALGASLIEKHFTLNREDGGVDSAFSLEPQELGSLVIETERAWQSLGRVNYGISSRQEEKSKQFRRTLFVSKDLNEGDTISEENIRSIRPGYGLPVKEKSNIIGRKVRQNIKKGTPLSWEILS